MSILNFSASDLKQINSRAIERLRSQDTPVEVKERTHAKGAKPSEFGPKNARYSAPPEGMVATQDDMIEKDGNAVAINPSSTAANFSKKHIRYVFKVAKKKLSEME